MGSDPACGVKESSSRANAEVEQEPIDDFAMALGSLPPVLKDEVVLTGETIVELFSRKSFLHTAESATSAKSLGDAGDCLGAGRLRARCSTAA